MENRVVTCPPNGESAGAVDDTVTSSGPAQVGAAGPPFSPGRDGRPPSSLPPSLPPSLKLRRVKKATAVKKATPGRSAVPLVRRTCPGVALAKTDGGGGCAVAESVAGSGPAEVGAARPPTPYHFPVGTVGPGRPICPPDLSRRSLGEDGWRRRLVQPMTQPHPQARLKWARRGRHPLPIHKDCAAAGESGHILSPG
jgi:hypothetical protein